MAVRFQRRTAGPTCAGAAPPESQNSKARTREGGGDSVCTAQSMYSRTVAKVRRDFALGSTVDGQPAGWLAGTPTGYPTRLRIKRQGYGSMYTRPLGAGYLKYLLDGGVVQSAFIVAMRDDHREHVYAG